MTIAPIPSNPQPPPPFRVDGWDVHPASAELVHAGETVRLEPRVMSVLVCLAQHSPDVVRRQDLLREVWGGAFVGEDVIWRCISDLRRAFGDDARRLIETLPRLGYRLCAEVVPLASSPPVAPAAARPATVAERPRAPALVAVASIVLALVAVAIAWWLRGGPTAPAAAPVGAVAPTAAAGVPPSAAELVRQGDEFYWRSDAKQKLRAAVLYEQALALDPAHAPAWAGLAAAHAWRYADGGDRLWLEKSLMAAHRAVALDPRLVAGYKALAQAETLRGRLGRAVQASLHALELEPGAPVIEYNLGCIHVELGELDRATTLFHRSQLLASGPAAIPCAYGRALRLLGALPEARALAEMGLAREPLDQCATSLLARLDLDAGTSAPALPSVLRALEATPDSMELLAIASELEQAMHREGDAMAHLRTLTAPRMVWEPLARARLAQLLWRERPDEARALLAASRRDATPSLDDGDETWGARLILAAADGVEGLGSPQLELLRDAVKHGYSDAVALRREPLFAPARREPGFAAFIGALEARLAEQRARALLPGKL